MSLALCKSRYEEFPNSTDTQGVGKSGDSSDAMAIRRGDQDMVSAGNLGQDEDLGVDPASGAGLGPVPDVDLDEVPALDAVLGLDEDPVVDLGVDPASDVGLGPVLGEASVPDDHRRLGHLDDQGNSSLLRIEDQMIDCCCQKSLV